MPGLPPTLRIQSSLVSVSAPLHLLGLVHHSDIVPNSASSDWKGGAVKDRTGSSWPRSDDMVSRSAVCS